MPLREAGLVFEERVEMRGSHPNRTDIVCFIGYIARRRAPLPKRILRWLDEQGWSRKPLARPDADSLNQLPIPLEAWEDFLEVFAWEDRPLADNTTDHATTTLGAAVRSFFAEGGRKCYVIRCGDPWPLLETAEAHETQRTSRLRTLLPGISTGVIDANNRGAWTSLLHLLGLPDVSFVSLPDLPEICGSPQPPAPRRPRLPSPFEPKFKECVPEFPEQEPPAARRLLWPRCNAEEMQTWATALNYAVRFLQAYRRDVQLVAAIPIADTAHLYRLLAERLPLLALRPEESTIGLSSAFVQLTYPWLRTRGSANLPEGIENPEGALLGMLARNALSRGAFTSACPLTPAQVLGAAPELDREQRLRLIPDEAARGRQFCLQERVSLFAEDARGWRLHSDVTASRANAFRPAAVNRLIAMVLRAARDAGADLVFESSQESLWRQARDIFTGLFEDLYRLGALNGDRIEDAFNVRCDRTTMTANDIDNGRLIVTVELQPAIPVERITVSLSLRDGGQIDLLRKERAA